MFQIAGGIVLGVIALIVLPFLCFFIYLGYLLFINKNNNERDINIKKENYWRALKNVFSKMTNWQKITNLFLIIFLLLVTITIFIFE